MNLVEVWFGIIERRAIHRGTFASVRDLTTKIRAFINGWNDRAHPFVWAKTAEQDSPQNNFNHGPPAAPDPKTYVILTRPSKLAIKPCYAAFLMAG